MSKMTKRMFARIFHGTRGKIVGLALVLLGFMYGALSERLHIFPSYQLRPLYAFLQKNLSKSEIGVSSTTIPDFRKVKSLESALLPLEAEIFSLPMVADINVAGGAICSLANKVIVLDRLGVPFSFDTRGQRFSALQWPQLENNYAEFLKSDRATGRRGFRVHGLLCLRDEGQTRILVAHEFFDPLTKFTHLVVSLLRTGSDLKSLDAKWSRVFMSAPLPSNTYTAIGAGGRMVLRGGGTG